MLLLGLSYAPVPEPDIEELEKDLFEFTRKLRLTFHFRNSSDYTDTSIIKLNSTFFPKRNTHFELEAMIANLEKMRIRKVNLKDNIPLLRSALSSLVNRTETNEILIKPADKGAITVIMDPNYYLQMCLRHLNDVSYYSLVETDPSDMLKQTITDFANKHQSILSPKEYEHLLYSRYKISNVYMLPKLHKSSRVDEIILENQTEYIHITEPIQLEGRPINSGPCYYTRGLSLIIHEVLQPCLKYIPHILKDSFDFKDRFQTNCKPETLLCTWDIKSLYTNIRHDLCITAVEYWLRELEECLPLMRRFTRAFILEALTIVLKFNYVTINGLFYHQHKGGAMGAPCMVVASNLTVAYLEVRMFIRLPDIFPNDFVDFFIRNYFRFIDDVVHQWLAEFDIEAFGTVMNGLDPDIKYILEQIAQRAHYLDIHMQVVGDEIKFDIYFKPTNSFTYLKYDSCHPLHTRKNLATSLARRIVQIVSENREGRLTELTEHLQARGHPLNTIQDALWKLMSPAPEPPTGEPITFVRTYNPQLVLDHNLIRNCFQNSRSKEIKKAFQKKYVLCTTRQPPNLKQMLTKAAFTMNPVPREPKRVGLVPCGQCKVCRLGYISPATSFSFTLYGKRRRITWSYNRLFTCKSMNILYFVQCANCPKYYVGKTKDGKHRCQKHASDVRLPANSNCRECSEHLRECSGLVEPYFRYFPFYYVDNPDQRHFIERRFIELWRPPLNDKS